MSEANIKTSQKMERNLPLLLKNMKKAFGQNIKGPVFQREREFKASIKYNFLSDLVKFLFIRGVEKLAAINTWETENNFDLAYHFITPIGKDYLDTKITIIVLLPKDVKEIKSIKKQYPNAGIFESEIQINLGIIFED